MQVLLAGDGVGAMGSIATTLLLCTVTFSWAAGRLPLSLRAAWWGVCALLGSAPVLVSAWATHLGLWTSIVDPVSSALLYLPVTAVKLLRIRAPLLVGVGVLLFVMFRLRAGLWRALAAVWAAVWTAAGHVGSYTAQVLTLARPADLGCFAVIAVVGCLCGTSLGEQLPPQVLGLLAVGLRFAASPVTAPLGLLKVCVEASAGVLWRALEHLLALLLPDAAEYLFLYILPQQLVLDLQTWVCAVKGKLVAAANSAIKRQLAADVGTLCAVLQTLAGARADLRVRPTHPWGMDLVLLAWIGYVCWRMWSFKSSTSVSAAVRAAELERRQRLEAGRQRKEAKAAERKPQKQLEGVGG